jgi:hypothetical protein
MKAKPIPAAFSFLLFLAVTVINIPQSFAHYGELPATISCPGGGSYTIDINGVADNGVGCSGNLVLDERVKSVADGAFNDAGITSLRLDRNLTQIGALSFNGANISSLELNIVH